MWQATCSRCNRRPAGHYAELIFVARKWGLDLRETPVRWRDSGETRVRPLAAAISSFQEILGIRAHDRRGCYVRPGSG